VIPDEAVEAAGDVLVYHQRQGIKGCACGWAEPGRSFPEHQARIALEAAMPHLLAGAFEEGYGWGYSDHVWSKGHEPRARNPYRKPSDA
jgi:hypothetical protein